MPRYEENQVIEQLRVDVDTLSQRISNAMRIVQEHNAPPLEELCYRLSLALVPQKEPEGLINRSDHTACPECGCMPGDRHDAGCNPFLKRFQDGGRIGGGMA